MSIGGILAKARSDAGLTISQVSERTRIREAIIRGIERDDYSGCGGDFYARGHIRSIAHVVGTDPAPLIEEYDATLRAPEELTAADALRPAMPIAVGARHRRRPNLTALLALALLAAIAVLGYHLASGSPHATSATATGDEVPHRHAAAHRAAAAHARPQPSRTAQAPVPVPLTPVSAVAFGPGGAGQGDNPQLASLALGGTPADPWQSDWYGTANFGNLQAGTGLLLDMGRPVTISSVRLTLGSIPGASLVLRAGNAPALASLAPVAQATDAGGVLQLRLTGPAPSRYLLIWFTRLPPDSSGTYQADVSGVRLEGQG